MATMERYAHGQFSWVDLMSVDTAASKAFYSELSRPRLRTTATAGGLLELAVTAGAAFEAFGA